MKYETSVRKALSNQRNKSEVVDSPRKELACKISNKGMITVTNFSTVNPVLQALATSEYNRARITINLSMEEHIKFQALITTDYTELVSKTVTVFNDFIKHNGIENGTSRFKEHARACIERLEGVASPKVDFAIGKDLNWPTKFHYLRPLLNLDNPEFATYRFSDQIIRTILGVSRIPEDYKAINLKHILVKNKLKRSVINEFEEYVRFRIQHPIHGFKEAGTSEFIKFGVRPNARTSKSGPNGLNKLVTASYEAAILLSDDLGKSFKELCKLTGNIPFWEYIERQGNSYISSYKTQCELNKDLEHSKRPIDLISRSTPEGKRRLNKNAEKAKALLGRLLKDAVGKDEANLILKTAGTRKPKVKTSSDRKPVTMFSDPSKGSLRTITAVPDTGNKSRTIAICDIWTQLLLEPFEEKLIGFLDKMFGETSAFHDHQKGFRKFKSKIRPGIKSYDLTSWTDYLPSVLQEIVVKLIFNEEIAANWSQLVVKCPWKSKDHDGLIRYGTGQGMGTKGSFIIASITDHFISELLLTKCYPDMVSTYPINHLYSRVGDDLWIWDPDDLIAKHLIDDYKMLINLGKSKTATADNICGEFVSMNLNYGHNVSRISMRNILDIRDSLYDIIPLLNHLVERSNADIDVLLNVLWNENLYPKSVWDRLYKGLSLELIVGERKPYKLKLHESLYKLNMQHNFSQSGILPYEEINRHKDGNHIKLLLKCYALNSDAKEIKSQIMKIRNIPSDLHTHWGNSVVKVSRDATIWDTTIQLHELITWCQYVDSSDLLDSIDPGILLYEILNSPDIDTANTRLDHYRSKLIGARSDLTFQNVDRLSPGNVSKVRSVQFILLSNHVVIDNVNGISTLKILDDTLYIDEFLESELAIKITNLNEMLFTGRETPNPLKGIPLNE